MIAITPLALGAAARQERRGFTLVELLTVVAILGVLASIAIPGFLLYLRRAKTSEATGNINELFQNGAALYARHTGADGAVQGLNAAIVTNCVAPSNPLSPANPGPEKQKFPGGPGFKLIDFTIADYVYYGYEMVSVGTGPGLSCGYTAGTQSLYTFRARGDLDGDGLQSLIELAAGSDTDDTLYHARGFHIVNEIE